MSGLQLLITSFFRNKMGTLKIRQWTSNKDLMGSSKWKWKKKNWRFQGLWWFHIHKKVFHFCWMEITKWIWGRRAAIMKWVRGRREAVMKWVWGRREAIMDVTKQNFSLMNHSTLNRFLIWCIGAYSPQNHNQKLTKTRITKGKLRIHIIIYTNHMRRLLSISVVFERLKWVLITKVLEAKKKQLAYLGNSTRSSAYIGYIGGNQIAR